MKIGLLPLYIKLYDDSTPSMREGGIDAFHTYVGDEFARRGVEVVNVPVCRVKPEFDAAIAKFEGEAVDAIVTLHLAYSPSLESSEALAKTKLPVIVLDTTPDWNFDNTIDSDAISYNHGIHGVQDMCNLLRRNGKSFEFFAGHIEHSDVIDRAVNALRGAVIAKAMRGQRVGIFGRPFAGMGDFAIPYDKLRETIGMTVVPFERGLPVISDDAVRAEYERDSMLRDMNGISYEDYARAERVALGIRGWIAENKITAFTMSFLDADKRSEFSVIPFTEACKQLEFGVGYAGEGDVMTAALVGSLLKVYPEATFTEMFCPDWQHDAIFISHMGEYNPRCTTGRAKYYCGPFPYADAYRPTKFIAPFKAGKAVFACLAPDANDKYTFILTEVDMLDTPANTSFSGSVNGWFKPRMPIADFLTAYSSYGGIHHATLTYGGSIAALEAFGRYMGWNTVKL